jgi:hypothetical protein
MDDTVFTNAGNLTAAECEAACAAAPDCQYFTRADAGGGSGACQLRGGGVAPGNASAPGAYVAFEVRPAFCRGGAKGASAAAAAAPARAALRAGPWAPRPRALLLLQPARPCLVSPDC